MPAQSRTTGKLTRPISSDGFLGSKLKKYNDRISAQFSDMRAPEHHPATGSYSEVNAPAFQQREASQALREQKCWKYHVLKMSAHEFYLTTNPDAKHMYCRNAPGYWCTLLLPNEKPARGQAQRDIGFRLVLIPKVGSELQEKDVVIVTKTPAGFEVAFSSMMALKEGHIRPVGTVKERVDVHEVLMQTPQTLSSDTANETLKMVLGTMHMYETDAIDRFGSFDVGPSPKVRQKTLNKLGLSNNIYKLADKGIVYFTANDMRIPKPKQNSSHGEVDVDSVVALFRPCDRQFKKLLSKKLRMKDNYLDNADDDDDLESINSVGSSPSSPIHFYKTGDGMLLKDPKDDSPNDDKVGWITLYEDTKLFAPTPEGTGSGMWELVLGLTFAVGFERIIDKYIEKETV